MGSAHDRDPAPVIPTATQNDKIIKEFERLSGLLCKYRHRWGENTSPRLHGWALSFEDLRAAHPEAHRAFATKHGLHRFVNAYDFLA